MTGTIKKSFFREKGYGFISPDDAPADGTKSDKGDLFPFQQFYILSPYETFYAKKLSFHISFLILSSLALWSTPVRRSASL